MRHNAEVQRTAARPLAFYDTECYPNYWLLKFRPRGVKTDGGGQVYSFRLFAGQAFSPEEALRIRTLFDLFTTVSFNGNYYDVPQLTAALQGYTVEQLKWIEDTSTRECHTATRFDDPACRGCEKLLT